MVQLSTILLHNHHLWGIKLTLMVTLCTIGNIMLHHLPIMLFQFHQNHLRHLQGLHDLHTLQLPLLHFNLLRLHLT